MDVPNFPNQNQSPDEGSLRQAADDPNTTPNRINTVVKSARKMLSRRRTFQLSTAIKRRRRLSKAGIRKTSQQFRRRELSFQRLVQEISDEVSVRPILWSEHAALSLQELAERHLETLLTVSYKNALHANRVTLMAEDIAVTFKVLKLFGYDMTR
ncbi:hypothetical protein AK830_g2024 [Neonectria ditissima]|uniref:Core Histone H2A/H2B/H3 domain-containing protein n=1 Tax=Neonectria ditissima TaxID=78410 RepID=A0A0P7BLA8_9HYPO|nr:hypothetical protein AK830_g2024 [Neonectria ditissima]